MKAVKIPQWLFCIVLSAMLCSVWADEPLSVLSVNPSGADVPAGRQIVIQFSRPVVPIGRMERSSSEVPVTVHPEPGCEWRWLDRSTLACQLGERTALQAATRYTVTVWPEAPGPDGKVPEKSFRHEFITERPRVSDTWFKTWKSPGTPVLHVNFNQPAGKSSVEQHLYYRLAGGKKTTRFALHAEADPDDTETPAMVGSEAARRVWLVSPQQPLPLASRIELLSEPGLMGAQGKEPGVDSRTVLAFDTLPEFRFLGMTCYDAEGDELFIDAAKQSQNAQCDPLNYVALNFSSPVLKSEVKNKLSITPDLAGGRKDYDPWANSEDYGHLHEEYEKDRRYSVKLPEILKAAQMYRVQNRQADNMLRDEFGRPLPKALDFSFATGHRTPDFRTGYEQAVLESQIDSEPPVYVTNLKQLSLRYKKLTGAGAVADQLLQIPLPKVDDLSFAVPLQARTMLNGKSGALYGRIDSDPPVKKSAQERTFFAQVSPYQVHVKIGHFNTLVWVTDFATGAPVSQAKVSIYKDALTSLSVPQTLLADGMTDASGIVLLKGTEQLDPKLDTFSWHCYKDDCPKLFVRIDKDSDIALLPLNNDFEVDSYRASAYSVFSSQQQQYGHIHSWGATAQGVYRAGDTLQYKFYVRNQDNRGFVAPPKSAYRLDIVDPSGKTVHQVKDIQLSAFGAYSGEYKIPETALVGWYRFRLYANFTDHEWEPMKVLVSDFTPSPFKVKTELNGDSFHFGDELDVQSAAKLHSGGPYTDAQARVTVKLSASYFHSEDPLAQGFSFDSYTGYEDKILAQNSEALDEQGERRFKYALAEKNIVYGKLHVESSVQDDRGKSIAARAVADYFAVDRLVGLKSSAWVFNEDHPATIHYVVVDAQGKPAAGTAVALNVQREETVTAKVKGAGNAYLTQFSTTWVDAGQCEGISKAEASICTFVPEQPGTYKITANIKDTHGQAHQTSLTVWVAGKGQVVWEQPDDNSLQIVPEKTEYKIGDTARYLIKNPYPGAYALVTLERYGVLKQWTQKFEDSTAIVEFPIDADLLPGFYLSVVAVSPRVAKPLGDGQIDLGKPAFKIGYVKVPVADPYKQIDVSIATDAESYKPRGEVKVKLKAAVKNPQGQQPIELAVAVLDEAVLDLIAGGTRYFDPYAGFYTLENLDLENYSLLTRLVGRQKFEKKGANTGGDGGAALSMRSLFKFVAYWNPALNTDAEGKAEFSFTLPDNLTGWRILAMAVTPDDRMGLSNKSFKVNQPTEIRPVMPNQVSEGDRFKAGFSVMNRTGNTRQLNVFISAQGDLTPAPRQLLAIDLQPFQRQTVQMDVQATPVAENRGVKDGEIVFSVSVADQSDGDALQHRLPVKKQRALSTAANYGSTLEAHIEESVQVPRDIYPDSGALSVSLAPTVIGNVDGAFRYMRDYPYTCWEQKLSKGVMAAHYQSLKAYLDPATQWLGSGEFPADILSQAANYQAPNGGMAFYLPKDEYVSPYLSAYTALVFNWLRDAGYPVPEFVEQNLHRYLDELLRKDVVPDYYSKGMASTVRAVALAALGKSGKIGLTDLQRYQTHVPYMSLFGKAHYLQAASMVQGGQAIAQAAAADIRSHAQQSAGKIAFNESLDGDFARILETPLRANCAILSALSRAQAADDLPFKLARSITQSRGSRTHWENTQENLFCMQALADYNRSYENVKPELQARVAIGEQTLGQTAFHAVTDPQVHFSKPLGAEDAGQERKISIARQGQGRLYYSTLLQYASRQIQSEPVNAGIDVRREYSVQRDGHWLLLDEARRESGGAAAVKRGELVRVDIYLSLPAARNFVVVDDKVPGGLEPINRDLATSSEVDAQQAEMAVAGGSWWFQHDDWREFSASLWSFYHRELKHDAVRFYSDYLPPGNYHLVYVAQAIAAGEFVRPAVHAEEMYDPDVYGNGKAGVLIVEENES